jgi:hypothetical protein
MQVVVHVRESTQVLMFSKKQWFEPRRMGSLWFLVACGSLSVSSLMLLSGQGSALRTENGRWPVYRALMS